MIYTCSHSTHSLIHSFTHSLTHSLTHSPTHPPLTHSFIQTHSPSTLRHPFARPHSLTHSPCSQGFQTSLYCLEKLTCSLGLPSQIASLVKHTPSPLPVRLCPLPGIALIFRIAQPDVSLSPFAHPSGLALVSSPRDWPSLRYRYPLPSWVIKREVTPYTFTQPYPSLNLIRLDSS